MDPNHLFPQPPTEKLPTMIPSHAQWSRAAISQELSRLRFQNEHLAQEILSLRDGNRHMVELKEKLERLQSENEELNKELQRSHTEMKNDRELQKIRDGLDDTNPDHISRDLLFNNILAAIESPTFDKTLRTENQELKWERQAVVQELQTKERELELEKKKVVEAQDEALKLRRLLSQNQQHFFQPFHYPMFQQPPWANAYTYPHAYSSPYRICPTYGMPVQSDSPPPQIMANDGHYPAFPTYGIPIQLDTLGPETPTTDSTSS